MSNLLERYLAAIGRQLPMKDRADITAELRDVLMNRMEERQDALGRPLSADEEGAILKAFGHPLVVAGGYRRTQQLIGPQVFPFFLFTLKIVLLSIAAVDVVGIAVGLIGGRSEILRPWLTSAVDVLVFAFGVVTLVFVAIERFGGAEALIAKWRPKDLPPVTAPPQDGRFERMTELVSMLVFILWWIGVVHFPRLDIKTPEGHVLIVAGAIWNTLYWPILVLAAVQVVLAAFSLARPAMVTTNTVARIVYGLAVIVLLALLIHAGTWVTIYSEGLSAQGAVKLKTAIDLGFRIALWVGILGLLFEILRSVWRLIQWSRETRPSAL